MVARSEETFSFVTCGSTIRGEPLEGPDSAIYLRQWARPIYDDKSRLSRVGMALKLLGITQEFQSQGDRTDA